MKRNLFLVAIFMGVSFPLAQAAFNVSSNTNVKVSDETLLYVNGSVKLDNYTGEQKVSNEGYIRITKGFTNGNGATGKSGGNFVNEYVPGETYGQLIIDDNATDDNATSVTGKVRGELQLANTFAYHPISFPFTNYTTSDLNRDAFNNNANFLGYVKGRNGYTGTKFDGDRWKNPISIWNNNEFRMDQLDDNVTLELGRYYALNTISSAPSNNKADVNNLTTYDGVPNNSGVSVTVRGYTLNDKSNLDTNMYGETYGSYISDFTQPIPSDNNGNWNDLRYGKPVATGDFGSNVFFLGNPFTSNIDLSKDPSFTDNVIAIYQNVSNTYVREDGHSDAGGLVTQAVTGDGAGDPVGIIRPFHTIMLKADLEPGASKTFNFTQAMKTFEVDTNTPNIMFQRGNSQPTIYQVGMDLYDADMKNTNKRFYVVAGNIYQAEAKGSTELYDFNLSEDTYGAYTLQETEEGAVASELMHNKTYINGVNFNYIGKPIHVVFQTNKPSTFTFKPRLNEALANSKYNFYFEDKQEGIIKKVDENFEYTFDIAETTPDRFVMYWMETPSDITPDEIEEIKDVKVAQTIVFKDFDQYKVRFDSDWNKADIFVYAISGQLLYSDKNVSTESDYTLKLNDNVNVYIVKVINEDGQSVSKKIIK